MSSTNRRLLINDYVAINMNSHFWRAILIGYWTTRGLPTRGLDMPRTGQLADATGDYACLIFVFWPYIDFLPVLKHILR